METSPRPLTADPGNLDAAVAEVKKHYTGPITLPPTFNARRYLDGMRTSAEAVERLRYSDLKRAMALYIPSRGGLAAALIYP
jgi:hypothetical protein